MVTYFSKSAEVHGYGALRKARRTRAGRDLELRKRELYERKIQTDSPGTELDPL